MPEAWSPLSRRSISATCSRRHTRAGRVMRRRSACISTSSSTARASSKVTRSCSADFSTTFSKTPSATHRRGGDVTLALAASPPGSCAISITDTGPGIPASLRPVIFERFSRGDASRSRKTGGAGLGLAICAAIVSAHKGTITLDDEDVGRNANHCATACYRAFRKGLRSRPTLGPSPRLVGGTAFIGDIKMGNRVLEVGERIRELVRAGSRNVRRVRAWLSTR